MASNMIISYGRRDEDDDYDSEEEERRKNGLFGGMMQHHMNKRGSLTVNSSGTKGTGGMALGAALANIKDNFNASMNFGDFDDDDNRSVSKKAKEAIKNFGDSLRFNKRDNDSSSEEEESDDDEDEDEDEDDDDDDEDDSDSDEEDEMDDDRSVASRTAKAMRKVTGKIGKALRLKSDDEDSDSDDDDDSEPEQEEDPLDNVRGSRGALGSSSLLPRLVMGGPFGSGNKDKDMKHDNSLGSDGGGGGGEGGGGKASRRRSNEREKKITNPFRRSSNSNSQQPHLRLPGFLTNSLTGGTNQDDDGECGKNCQVAKAAARVLAQEEFDGGAAAAEEEEVPSRRRRREARNKARLTRSATSDPHKSGGARPGLHRCHTTTAAPADVSPSRKAAAKIKAQEEFMQPSQAAWSMNVTEKMLEQATSDGVYVPPKTKKGSRRQRSQK